MKTTLIVIGIIVLVLLVLFFVFGYLLIDFALVRKSSIFMDVFKIKKIEQTIAVPGTHPNLESKYDDYPLEERVQLMKCEMDLDDDHKELWTEGEKGKLRAYLYDSADTHKWIILVHGYGNNAAMMVRMMDAHKELIPKYKVLLPDLIAHGSSDGKHISMGYNDRLTVKKWIAEILKMDPEASIALYGISMGAATVMITSGEDDLPENVKCVVEDCGYTSADEQFADVLYSAAKLPKNPLIPYMNLFCKMRAGYSLYDASPINGVRKTKLPMFFVHGEADDFVPTRMVHPLYEACNTEKELLLIPDAIHAKSCKTHPEIYWPPVLKFLEKHL